ncbi:unnamed protein product [Timema podura]|uniref:Uncharacterized protein n=1 Tax=Timema podura TaxID=61482 RepID=A0ABN7NJS8_TIMPD|nr:unnamed protein product [Timema podura]
MGCGSSNRTSSVAPEESTGTPATPDVSNHYHNTPSLHRPADDSLSDSVRLSSSSPSLAPRRPVAQPMAFEVPVTEESLIRKHPPKRFQKLEDQQMTTPLSKEMLDERQAEARSRRIQILSQRVQSAKQRVPRKRMDNGDVSPADDAIETINRENSSVEL